MKRNKQQNEKKQIPFILLLVTIAQDKDHMRGLSAAVF